jgi:hypothetical protein
MGTRGSDTGFRQYDEQVAGMISALLAFAAVDFGL